MSETYIKAYKFEILPNDIQKKFLARHFGDCRMIYNKILDETLPIYTQWDNARKEFYKNPDNRGKKFTEMEKPYITRNSISSKNTPYTSISQYREEITDTEGVQFLKEVDSIALGYVAQHIESAYKAYENPNLPNAGMPKKRGKAGKQSYTTKRCTNSNQDRFNLLEGNLQLDCENQLLLLPKFGSVWKRYGVAPGWIKVIMHRDIRIPNNPCYITEATLSLTPEGKYYVSMIVHYEQNPFETLVPSDKEIGVSFACANEIAIVSDGKNYQKYYGVDKEKLSRIDQHINDLKQKRSRMQGPHRENGVCIPPSNNYLKITQQINKLYARRSRIIQYNTHLISKKIVSSGSTIYVRDFAAKDYIEQQKAKHPDMSNDDIAYLTSQAADANIGNLITQIEYKSDAYGKKCVKIDRMFPCSQICSACGELISNKGDLSDKSWTCPKCGKKHDQFINSANNILTEGRNIDISPEEYKKMVAEKKKQTANRKKAITYRLNALIKEYNQSHEEHPIKINKGKVNSIATELSVQKDLTDDELINLVKQMVSKDKTTTIGRKK